MHQQQQLSMSSFPVDSILNVPPSSPAVAVVEQKVEALRRQAPVVAAVEQPPPTEAAATPSLNPVVALSVATVMMVVALVTTTAIAPTPVVDVSSSSPTLTPQERLVQQAARDQQVSDEMVAAEVVSWAGDFGFY